MTVSMQVTKRIYAGNGVTRQWDVDFPFSSPEHVRAYITSPAGAETALEEDFKLNATGTALIYPTEESGKPPLAEGWSITLVRQTPLTQEIDLIRQGELDAEVLESGYDKLTLIVQELEEKVSRSIKYPVSTSINNLETDNFLKNILSVKQDAVSASSSAVTAAQNAQQSASTAQQTAQSALAAIASALDGAQSDISQSGEELQTLLQTYAASAQEDAETARYYAEHSVGKMVGEIYYSQSNLASDNPGALPLFTGETVTNAAGIYPDFYDFVTAHAGLCCTQSAYEAAVSAVGECPKYVVSGNNLRLPLIKKMGEPSWNGGNLNCRYYPWVVAYNTAMPAAAAQTAQFQEALSGKADTSLGNVASNIDYVVERFISGTNWYRRYKSGWLEQGGATNVSTSKPYVTFLKPFANTDYTLLVSGKNNASAYTHGYDNKTTAGFAEWQYQNHYGCEWYACGQGA